MTNDVGALRLLSYGAPAPTPLRPRAALKEIRQDARELRRLAGQGAAAPMPAPVSAQAYYAPPPAPMALAYFQGMVQAFADLLGSLLSWLHLAPAPAPQPSPGPGPVHPPSGPAPQPGGATKFTVSSFNILGSSHTVPGADAAHYAPGPTRMRWAAQLIEQKGVDVVGFQELNADQATAFMDATQGDFGIYPGNKLKGGLTPHNSIAWRKAEWDLVDARVVDMVGHKGRNQPSPVVRLRNKATGEEAIFLNFHNAPGFHIGTQQGNRDKARAQQVELVNRLRRETGLPIIVTGDMNEKDAYYRDMTTKAGMHAANEGKNGQAPRQMGIDWIFGSAGVRFSKFLRERGALQKKVSDHGMLVSEVRLG